MSGVIIRKATEADYQGVIGITPNLYEGGDYIPSCYHAMVKDPKRLLLVVEMDTFIVGFVMFYIVDEDQCVVGQAGRIKAEHRGKLLSIKMMQHAFTLIHQQFPTVKALSMVSPNEQEMYKLQFNPSLKKFFYRNLVRIRTSDSRILSGAVSSPQFQFISSRLPVHMTNPLTPSEALRILDRVANDQSILTDHCWIINYESLKPLHSNHLTLTHSNTKGVPVVMVTREDREVVTAISFGTVTHIDKGLFFKIDFYCHRTMKSNHAGKLLLLTHMIQHSILLNQLKQGGIRIMDILVPKEMNKEKVLECLTEVGIKGYKVEESKKRAYCAETNLSYVTRHQL